MRYRLSRRLLVPVLCMLPALTAPAASATDGPGTGTEVARLYDETAKATATYEHGRHAADAERARARRMERLLVGKRRELAVFHDQMGLVARAEYRSGSGAVAYPVQLLMADSPEEMLRGMELADQADAAFSRMMERAQLAENSYVRAETAAKKAWRELSSRQRRLAEIKESVETKLRDARQRLQSEAERSVAAGRCAGPVRMDTGGSARAWVTPVVTYSLSAGFDSAGSHWAHRHTGQDFAVDLGTPVRAAGAGRVASVSCGGGFGIEVVIKHPNGYYTQYAHLSAAAVDQGEKVRAGQWIGQSGSTGNSTGPHLHFEVRLTPYLGSGIDPVPWLREHGVKV
ncbi:M23 family metallopeptidase [Streptomyces beijiangensis]|uniref:Peptidoglycan DD-metalloendopeptidase family protein n=1 Tax=Streptomyces beijiangensis TaxID=163361 RepID=A0A939F176_9ACTN|nr:M23 family metallopeptidase [Streptomyces beijiangensis]MBO0510310.1 peptidoglycan DD-metalloendopeptidase family protein [Streptomyces beijiangensis]